MPEEYIEFGTLARLVRENPCVTPTQLLELARSQVQHLCGTVGFEDIDNALDGSDLLDAPLADERKIEVLMEYSKGIDWSEVYDKLLSIIPKVIKEAQS